jgi:hypothetical protein
VEVKKSSLIREGKMFTVVNIYMVRCRYESQLESVCIPGRREDHYQPSWCQLPVKNVRKDWTWLGKD